VSEERDIPAPVDAVWRIVSDTTRWPSFFATPREVLHLRSVELLDGATKDGPGVKRRLHFLGVPSWDEQVTRWREHDGITWLGVRNPGQKYWTQQIELIPGRGFTTLRWDVYYSLSGPDFPLAKKVYKRTMEDILLSSLARVEKLAVGEAK
jgi:uncharacterized protein YndB with AHSA1/START domain